MQKNLHVINSDLHVIVHSELQNNNKDSAEWKIANKKTLTYHTCVQLYMYFICMVVF